MTNTRRTILSRAVSALKSAVCRFWRRFFPEKRAEWDVYPEEYDDLFLRAIYKAGYRSPQSKLLARIALNVLHDPKKYPVSVSDLLLLDDEQRGALVAFLNGRAAVPYKHLRPAERVERFLVTAFPEHYDTFKPARCHVVPPPPLRLAAVHGHRLEP